MIGEATRGRRLAGAGFWLGLAITLGHPIPAAGQSARAEIVQPPAWIDHETGPEALGVGTALPPTTSIKTGESGAVALLLGSAGQLGLGPQTRLYVQRRSSPGNAQQMDFRLAEGSMRLLVDDAGAGVDTWVIDAGSLRLEGDAADLWLRRRDEDVAVCLMDGRVQVTHPQIGDFYLEQAFSCFESPNDGLPTPVLPIARADAISLVTTTAPQSGLGRMRSGAGWVIQLISVGDADKAARLARGLRESGYPAESEIGRADGRRLYRLKLAGFESREDAQSIATRLTGRFGINRPWVSCPESPPCRP